MPSEYVDLVAEMQNNSVNENSRIPALVGKRNGLRLVLDLNSYSQSLGSVTEDFSAFKVFIGNPEEFPVLDESGILLEPGHEHFLSLASQVYSADGIEGLAPKKRDCYFPDEGGLDFYKKYTYVNCKFECGIKLVEAVLHCIPWFLPHGSNSTVCDPWTTRTFSHMLGGIHSNTENCKHCLPDCSTIETTVMTSAAKFRQQII